MTSAAASLSAYPLPSSFHATKELQVYEYNVVTTSIRSKKLAAAETDLEFIYKLLCDQSTGALRNSLLSKASRIRNRTSRIAGSTKPNPRA